MGKKKRLSTPPQDLWMGRPSTGINRDDNFLIRYCFCKKVHYEINIWLSMVPRISRDRAYKPISCHGSRTLCVIFYRFDEFYKISLRDRIN